MAYILMQQVDLSLCLIVGLPELMCPNLGRGYPSIPTVLNNGHADRSVLGIEVYASGGI